MANSNHFLLLSLLSEVPAPSLGRGTQQRILLYAVLLKFAMEHTGIHDTSSVEDGRSRSRSHSATCSDASSDDDVHRGRAYFRTPFRFPTRPPVRPVDGVRRMPSMSPMASTTTSAFEAPPTPAAGAPRPPDADGATHHSAPSPSPAMSDVDMGSGSHPDVLVRNAPAMPKTPLFKGETAEERRRFMRDYQVYLDQCMALQAGEVAPFIMPVDACIEY